MEAVRHLDALLHALAETPAPVLRSFGLGVRDLRRLARDTGTTEPVTALLLEIAYAAGLLTYTDAAHRSRRTEPSAWLPAPAYDTWRGADLAHRWALLARTWLTMTRAPVLVGQRDDRDKPISALSDEVQPAQRPPLLAGPCWACSPTCRRAPRPSAEAVLTGWPGGRRAGSPGRSPAGPHALARAVLTEAATLGITGLDAMTTYGRAAARRASGATPTTIRLGIRAIARDPPTSWSPRSPVCCRHPSTTCSCRPT